MSFALIDANSITTSFGAVFVVISCASLGITSNFRSASSKISFLLGEADANIICFICFILLFGFILLELSNSPIEQKSSFSYTFAYKKLFCHS